MEKMLSIETIQSKIYIIRGKKVMIDSDLAKLYGVQNKALNQAVKRNNNRFPEDFMFKLVENEYNNLRSQIVTANYNMKRFMPNVFTEHGILMLSSVLNSERAAQVNIQIMRAFVKMREMITSSIKINNKLKDLESKYDQHDKEIGLIFEAIKQLMEPEVDESSKRIGFI